MFVPGEPFQPSAILLARLTQVKHLSGYPLTDLALPTNIRPGLKGLTFTQAYYQHFKFAEENGFINHWAKAGES